MLFQRKTQTLEAGADEFGVENGGQCLAFSATQWEDAVLRTLDPPELRFSPVQFKPPRGRTVLPSSRRTAHVCDSSSLKWRVHDATLISSWAKKSSFCVLKDAVHDHDLLTPLMQIILVDAQTIEPGLFEAHGGGEAGT